MYGLESHSPYTEASFVEWAIGFTERSDCIGTRPIRLVHGGEAVEHETGKLVLRQVDELLLRAYGYSRECSCLATHEGRVRHPAVWPE